jgi:hypothetical protein
VALLREPVAAEPQEGDVADPSVGGDAEEGRAAHWELGGRSLAEAEKIAWAEMQNRWHMEHGERVSRDLWAGCRRPIEAATALDLIDGNRVHADDGNSCLIRHGERWRAAARRALIGAGFATAGR